MFNAHGLLPGENLFAVNGLTLNEVAAEKILGYTTKEELYKHLADLVLIVRDHGDELDQDTIARLVRKSSTRSAPHRGVAKGTRRWR